MKTLLALLILQSFTMNFKIYGQMARWLEKPPSVYETPLDSMAAWRRGYFEGYTQSPSIVQGGTVQFKVSTKAAILPNKEITTVSSRMKIYRVDSTSIAGDILMSSEIQFSATFYPLHDKNDLLLFPEDSITHNNNEIYPVEYKKGCDWANWAVAASYTIPSNFPSGFYYAKLYLPGQENNPDQVGYIPFVVRPSDPGSNSKILCVIAWNTYQAYNYWGGGSLYWWTGEFDVIAEGSSIETVSFRRPFGWHWHEVYTASTQFGELDERERNFIAWAENNGYQMEYCIDSDISGGTFATAEYKAIIFPGHSEYWDFFQRENVEQATQSFKSRGGNLIFLAPNNCYWKVIYKPNEISSNPDSMYCYKYEMPGIPNHDGYYLWRNQEEGPEGQFIGVQFYGVNDINAHQYVENADHWIFRGTELSNNDAFGFGGPIASGESDMKRDEYSPANTILLARTPTGDSVQHYPYYGEDLYADMTYYEDIETNSRVFASGGQGWSESFYGSDGDKIVTMTKNILDHFSMKKYIGNVYRQRESPLEWIENIVLDGNVNVLPEKGLRVNGSALPITVTIDSILFVDGTLDVLGDVTFDGNGSFNINPTGNLLLRSNSTLTVNSYFVLENGTNQITFEPGSKLIINNATLESGATLIVGSNGTLEVKPGSLLYAPGGSKIEVNGSLIANGSEPNKITFDFVEPDNENENGIKVNFGGEIIISDTIVKNAFKGINIVGGDRSSIQYSLIQYCNVGINIEYENKDCDLKIMYNEIKNNSGYGIRIHNPGFGMNSEPFVSDNYIASCYFGIHLTGDVCALIQKSVVENCTNGIYVYDAQPSILNNTIHNPLQNGIYLNAPGKSPLILDNTITKENRLSSYHNYQGIWVENNTTAYIAHNDISGFFHGIYCGGGVNSYFGNYNFHDLYPNNRIRDNLIGFAAGLGSYIYAGKGIGDGCWNNSIYGNRDYDAVSYQYSYVMAQYNYWGGDRPNAYVDETSELYADDLLERDPWGENKLLAGSSNNPLPIEGGNSDIIKGILLEKNGQINEAVKHYKQMVSKNSYAGFALTELLKFRKKYSVTGVQNYFGTLISANNINKDKVLRILAAIYLDENRYEEAMQTYTTIINQFPNSRNAVYARFDKFYAALNHAQNLTTAGQLLQEVRALGLTDDEFLMKLEFAETLYNSESGSLSLGKSTVQTVKQQTQQTLPNEYELLGNYPNPFNPSTTISYALPFESEVSITIYDLTGSIIKSFDLNNQSAGYKNVIWDGRNNYGEFISSGVYIYTIRTFSLEGNGKSFAKSSKLMLLK